MFVDASHAENVITQRLHLCFYIYWYGEDRLAINMTEHSMVGVFWFIIRGVEVW